METKEVVLSVEGVSKRFPGVLALDHVNFELKRGEVHALIGENGAGKSTLMKILLGIYSADGGTITYKGKQVSISSPHTALKMGISMIHQEVSLIPTINVAENIWIGRESQFASGGIINNKKRMIATQELLDEWGIQLNCMQPVYTLSMAEMQLVEIARAISYQSDIIIMDEPTSSLAEHEVQVLYRIIRSLSQKGVSIIFISHKLEEIFDVCDRVTVFRDGGYIATRRCCDITIDELVTMIVGREINQLFPKEKAEIGDVVLEAKDLCLGKILHHISFQLHRGEILGFSGLVGAGRTEIMNAIFGVTPPTSGEIYINGEKVEIKSPRDAIQHGIGMVTEDRLHLGILPLLSVKTNITLAALKKIEGYIGLLSNKKEDQIADGLIETMGVKVSTPKQLISDLSGGNQQKAVIARWLNVEPAILILDEPTRGIDVGSKSEIHRYMSKLAQQGLAIILVSSELPEILGMSDRIIVVHEGTLVSEYKRGDVDQEQLIRDAFGTVDNSQIKS